MENDSGKIKYNRKDNSIEYKGKVYSIKDLSLEQLRDLDALLGQKQALIEGRIEELLDEGRIN